MLINKKEEFVEKPLVTVLICTYNRADSLKKCLDSMFDQTYEKFEVIIVNGPSTDETKTILRKYPFKFIQQKNNGGLSAARNLGIREAKGEIIAFIDDDAVADENWIKSHVKKYKDEKVGGVGGKIYEKNGKMNEYCTKVNKFGILAKENKIVNSGYIWFNTTCGCNTSFRRKVLEEIGGFDEYYTYWFDETDVCVRIAKGGYKIEYETDAIVYHYHLDGPERSRVWYHKVQKQWYFTFKNFGDELPLILIIYTDLKIYIYDTIFITILLLLGKMHPLMYLNSLKYMITGRIQGYKDGIKARIEHKKVI